MRYFILSIGINESIVAAYNDLHRADHHYIENKCFNTVADWVEEYGYFVCNSDDWDSTKNVEVIIDTSFSANKDSDSYEVTGYYHYKSLVDELLRSLIK